MTHNPCVQPSPRPLNRCVNTWSGTNARCVFSQGASSKLSTNQEFRHSDGLWGANHVGVIRFTGPETKLRRTPELDTRRMVHKITNVTCDSLLGTACIVLNGIMATVTLHFLFYLHFPFHLFFGLLFNLTPGKRRWNARHILTK